MIKRVSAAGVRAFCVAWVIAAPALFLPGMRADSAQIATILAFLAALMVFVEYTSDYPSVVEFRNAPPYNRLRFLGLFLTVGLLVVAVRGDYAPTVLSDLLQHIGFALGTALDFPFSPVRLMVLLLPPAAGAGLQQSLVLQLGLATTVAFAVLVIFVAVVRLLDWPIQRGAFNVWINLPMFDPTMGGDVIARLRRDAQINIALGCLMPFLAPGLLQASAEIGYTPDFADPQTSIWVVSLWAFLPVSLLMRGVALSRIADLIAEKRRRAYARADFQPA